MQTNNLVLASSSPYRKQLLQKLHLDFITATPDIDESQHSGEPPAQMALRLAKEKARALKAAYPQHFIIASDQVAMLNQTQLKKPGDKNNAFNQLQQCSAKVVKFYTSVCILDSSTGELKSALDICSVYFKKLSKQKIINYIDLEQPYHCAGSFKSEGLGIALFERIEGDDPNALVGLPLIKLISLLDAFNIDVLAKGEAQ
ncbi:MAG: septum formation inhibitor Maf [Methyloprofundus sp.]|nr:septum formation inhibitor Maf [Methyloprofundus sp.]